MKMLADPNAPAAVRVRAADSVLKHARCGMEIEDIKARKSEMRRLVQKPEVHDPSHAIEVVMRLNAARTRINQENELARQTAAAAAAMEEIETTEA